MNIDKTGIILFTTNFSKCVTFYRDILELKILFEKENLTCFDFGGSYLMIEPKSNNSLSETNNSLNNNLCLRFNVSKFQKSCEKLESLGVNIKVNHYDWGSVGRFQDPDGNNCSIKDSTKFELQIQNYKQSI